MRLMTWGVLCVRSLIWNTAASGKEILPREIYEQAAPAVAIVIVMGHADGGRKGSGETWTADPHHWGDQCRGRKFQWGMGNHVIQTEG